MRARNVFAFIIFEVEGMARLDYRFVGVVVLFLILMEDMVTRKG